jgi:hypothetical protein
MTSPDVPHNAYTNAPEQHPNLILGSLQLLFWLFFRPSAWQHHIARIDTVLHPDSDSANPSSWRNPALWRLLIQAYLVLPVLVNLPLFLVQWGFAEFGQNIEFRVEFDVLFSAVFGVALGVALGARSIKALGVMFILAISVMFTLAKHVTPDFVVSVIRDIVIGVVLIRNLAVIPVAVSVLFLVFGSFQILTAGDDDKKVAGGRKIIFNALIGLIVSLIAYSLLAVVRGSLEVTASSTNSSLVFNLLLGLAYTVIGIVVAVSVLFLVFGSFQILTAGDDDKKVAGGRKIIFNALIGLIVSLTAFMIVALIGGSLEGTVPNIVPIVVFGVGLTLNLWRPVVLYPFLAVWDTLLYQLDKRRTDSKFSLLRWHCAFWDEFQRLPLRGLDEHLFLVMERNPTEGNTAIEYLNTSHQRWATQEVQIELDAHRLDGCEDVEAIRQVHNSLTIGELQGSANYLLRSFSRISEDIDAALNQESAYNQREALRYVADRLSSFLQELTRSSGKYTVRFRPITASWKQILTNYLLELDAEVERRQEIDNPYIIGVPLTEQHEVFVKPTDISGTDISKRIEQLLLDRRRPPLLLYGQRRMGKTSLLNNLGHLLPTTIVPMSVSLQGPVSLTKDYAGFLYNIARGMVESAERKRGLTLPPLTRERLESDPFTCFDEWLDKVEQELEKDTVLLALDEFEALDSAIVKGRFDEEDVLGMLRHLIQHRPRFKVLLSGSHTLEEFQRWASYLINVQVVHISYLKETEARKLIVKPVEDFALRYESEAVQRVLDLTRCHPYLVQLLCAEIVALKNEQEPSVRRLATLADVEKAVPEALSSGSFFFADIERNQINDAGLALLRFMATRGEGAIVSREILSQRFQNELDKTLNLLLRRELIEPVEDGYRFQVELIRRWFA